MITTGEIKYEEITEISRQLIEKQYYTAFKALEQDSQGSSVAPLITS